MDDELPQGWWDQFTEGTMDGWLPADEAETTPVTEEALRLAWDCAREGTMNDDEGLRYATADEVAQAQHVMVPILQWSVTELANAAPCETCGLLHRLVLLSIAIDIAHRPDLCALGEPLVNEQLRTGIRIGALAAPGATDIGGLVVEVRTAQPDTHLALAIGPLDPDTCDELTHCSGVRLITSSWPVACIIPVPEGWRESFAAVRTQLAVRASGGQLDSHALCPRCTAVYVVGEGVTYDGVEYCTRTCAVQATGRY